VRCPRCGNENSGGNRFCGMCGASLIAASQPAATPAASRQKREEVEGERFSDEPRLPARPAPSTPPEPSVNGPSFLGLNKPGDGQRGRQDLHGRSSLSADYLLEDDDEEPKGGGGKLALVLIALALAGVFGYLYWRQGGFDSLLKSNKSAPAAQSTPAEPATDATPTPAPSDSAANTPAASSSSANANPPNQPTANKTTGSAPQHNPSPVSSTAPSTATSATPAQADAPPDSTASPAPTPENTATPPGAETSSTEKSSPEKAANTDDATDSEPAETAKPSPAPRKIRKPTPATPLDIGAEADRYIYGRGVPQDCDRGLRLLKSSAQYDPKAMIRLGVLYSSGTCAPRDLPTAYRWFAMALHKDPNNQAVQDDLQQLWGQMTQPERQLAIKLSQ
jgi:hypothetical protein